MLSLFKILKDFDIISTAWQDGINLATDKAFLQPSNDCCSKLDQAIGLPWTDTQHSGASTASSMSFVQGQACLLSRLLQVTLLIINPTFNFFSSGCESSSGDRQDSSTRTAMWISVNIFTFLKNVLKFPWKKLYTNSEYKFCVLLDSSL